MVNPDIEETQVAQKQGKHAPAASAEAVVEQVVEEAAV